MTLCTIQQCFSFCCYYRKANQGHLEEIADVIFIMYNIGYNVGTIDSYSVRYENTHKLFIVTVILISFVQFFKTLVSLVYKVRSESVIRMNLLSCACVQNGL